MERLKSFIDINKRIVLNLIELDEQNASQGGCGYWCVGSFGVSRL